MASKEAYAIACVELFTRVWMELEFLAAADDAMHTPSAGFSAARRVEVLRIELILILDACRSARWRTQLDSAQRISLQSILSDVLDALSAEKVLRGKIQWAQNRLLDAILDQCATSSAAVDRTNRRAGLGCHFAQKVSF